MTVMDSKLTRHWEVRSLDGISEQVLGKMLDKSKNRGTLRPYLRNVNVRWFNFDLTDVKEMRFEDDEYERYTVQKGDLVICEGGYPGRAAIWPYDEPIFFQKALHRVRFRESAYAKWFLYYLFLSDADGSLQSHFTGTGIQHLTGQSLRRFRFPLPPLSEQKRIAAILDEAFEGIDTAAANAEKNLANARELFNSYVAAILQGDSDWLETTIGDEIDLQTGFAFRSSNYTSGLDGIRLLRGDNIVQGELRWDDVKRWPSTDRATYSEYELKENDIVLAMDRTWVKAGIKFARISRDDVPALLVQRVARMRCRKTLSGGLLFHLLGSRLFERYVLEIQTGLGVPHISGKQIQAFHFKMPSIVAQHRIIAKLDAMRAHCESLVTNYQHKIALLDALKQSILHKAFAGELTAHPQQALDEAAE